MERYKRMFECDCSSCEKRETCEKKKNLKEYINFCEECSCDLNMDQGDQYEDNVETKTGDWESSTDNDFADGGEEFGDTPAKDDNWSESIKKRYIKKFKENDTVCEDCPDGSKPVGGSCARLDKNGNPGAKIQGRCDKGFTYDPKQGKCIRIPK